MSLVSAIVVFLVGALTGIVTKAVARLAAIVALVLAILGIAVTGGAIEFLDPVLSFYRGNELLFLSGFLFAIADRGALISIDRSD